MLYFALLAWDSWLFIRWRLSHSFPRCPFSVLCPGQKEAKVLIALKIRSRRPTCVPDLLPIPTLCVFTWSFPIKCLKTGSFLKIESSTAKNSSGPAVVPRKMEKNRSWSAGEREDNHACFSPHSIFSLRKTDHRQLRTSLKLTSNLLRWPFLHFQERKRRVHLITWLLVTCSSTLPRRFLSAHICHLFSYVNLKTRCEIRTCSELSPHLGHCSDPLMLRVWNAVFTALFSSSSIERHQRAVLHSTINLNLVAWVRFSKI